MAVFIIPVAISVHTIISWILATTLQPGWHSTIFGPYFVVGAIFSGIGALFVAMTAVRAWGLEDYIKQRQYRSLGLLFITMNVIWAYFTYAENLAPAAGQQADEFPVLASKLWGSFSSGFWVMVLLMIVAFAVLVLPRLVPASVRRVVALRPRYALGSVAAVTALAVVLTDQQLAPLSASTTEPDVRVLGWAVVASVAVAALLGIGLWLKQRPVTATVVAGLVVLIGMWLERWNLIVPTVTHPRLMPYATYTPT
jgi:molybdopterin-containing oxidoreductase family membrane subunit